MSTYNSPADVNPITRALSAIPNGIDAACATAFALIPDETLMKQGKVTYAVDSANVANAYTITLAVSPASYADGLLISCRPLVSNSGAATINVNGLGVKSIRNIDSTALSAGAIVAGSAFIIVYSTTTGYFHLLTSALYQQASGSFATLNGVESMSNKTISSSTISSGSLTASVDNFAPSITYGTNATGDAVYANKLGNLITLNARVSWLGAGSLLGFMTLPSGYRPAADMNCAGRLTDVSAGPAYFGVLVYISTNGTVNLTSISLDGVLHGVTPANGDQILFSISFPTA